MTGLSQSWTHCSCGLSAQDQPGNIILWTGEGTHKRHLPQGTTGNHECRRRYNFLEWCDLPSHGLEIRFTVGFKSDTNKLQYRTTCETLSQSKFYYETLNLVSDFEISTKKRIYTQCTCTHTHTHFWKSEHCFKEFKPSVQDERMG